MSDNETYEGWSNRETWAVALHINNDQGWQESVHEALREYIADPRSEWGDADISAESRAREAGEVIRENVEEALDSANFEDGDAWGQCAAPILRDIGSLWRVNWTELGAAFLADIED